MAREPKKKLSETISEKTRKKSAGVKQKKSDERAAANKKVDAQKRNTVKAPSKKPAAAKKNAQQVRTKKAPPPRPPVVRQKRNRVVEVEEVEEMDEEEDDEEEEEEEEDGQHQQEVDEVSEHETGRQSLPLAPLNSTTLPVIASTTQRQIELALDHLHEKSSPLSPFAIGSMHEKVLNTLTNLIVAGAKLGHRTSHCVWGSPCSGKRRVLRLLGDRLRKRRTSSGKFICLTLDADMFRQDEVGAVWSLLQQVQWELENKRLDQVEKRAWDNTFETLFSSLPPSLLSGSLSASTRAHFLTSGTTGGAGGNNKDGGSAGGGKGGGPLRNRFLAPNNSFPFPDSSSDSSDDDDEYNGGAQKKAKNRNGKGKKHNRHGDEEDDDDADCYDAFDDDGDDEEVDHQVTLIGGAGLLAGLQGILLKLSEAGFSLVIMIHNIEMFALWNDRLTYILAGLMHEVEAPAGGISLVMTANSASVPIEKRLSSRLSCEMWFLQPVRINLAEVVESCLDLAYEELRESNQLPTTTTEEEEGTSLVLPLDDEGNQSTAEGYHWALANQEHLEILRYMSDKLQCLCTRADEVQQAAATYLMSQSVYMLRVGSPNSAAGDSSGKRGGGGQAGGSVDGITLCLKLQSEEFDCLLTLQESGDIFDYLLGTTRLSVGPYRASATNETAYVEELPDIDEALGFTTTTTSSYADAGRGSKKKGNNNNTKVGSIDTNGSVWKVAAAPKRWFPAWKTNCPKEMFFLMWMVYINEDRREERSFHETFINICGNTSSERAAYKVSYQRALHELERLRVIKVSRKGILSLVAAKSRLYLFLCRVLGDELIASSCGIAKEQITKMKTLAGVV